VTVELEPWEGKAPPSDIAGHGFLDYYDPEERPGHNPVPVSFAIEHKGKRIRLSPCMYCDLFYLRAVSIEPTAGGCVIHLEGSDAGGHYKGRLYADLNIVYKRVVWDAKSPQWRTVTTWGYHVGDTYDRRLDIEKQEEEMASGR
jgi:hypothetical protein